MSRLAAIAHKVSGVPGAAGALATGRLPVRGRGAAVLCYHDVGTDPANRTDYYLGPDLFRAHLEWIRAWGLTVVPLAEIVDRHAGGRDLDGLVAITFDDALHGVLEHAAPILEEHHAPATVFVVTDVVGVDPPFWPGAARTLRPDELQELCASGLVTLGSHTATHASLPDVAPDVRLLAVDTETYGIDRVHSDVRAIRFADQRIKLRFHAVGDRKILGEIENAFASSKRAERTHGRS